MDFWDTVRTMRSSMLLRLTPALAIILMTGCTSSEPQTTASPAPLALNPAGMPASTSKPAPTSHPIGSTGQEPTGGSVDALAVQHGYNCRTVGNATMCDAPAIPSGEDPLYTN
jgi:hypothetical protein